MFLGFELRHPEQEAKHVELVASRQPGQLGNGLRNDGRASSGPPSPAGSSLLPLP